MLKRLLGNRHGFGTPVSGAARVLCRRNLGFAACEHFDNGLVNPSGYSGNILVLQSDAILRFTSRSIKELKLKRLSPAGFVLNNASVEFTKACLAAGIPLMDGFREDVTRAIPDGARIHIDANAPFLVFETLRQKEAPQ